MDPGGRCRGRGSTSALRSASPLPAPAGAAGISIDDLWRAIEAAGPLTHEEALAQPPPPGVDYGEWAERALNQTARRRSFISQFAYSVPTPDAIQAIVEFVEGRKLLEVCAGAGLWSFLLASIGVDTVATDAGDLLDRYREVEVCDAEDAVRRHADCRALMLCWPPMGSDCAARAAGAFQGDRMIYAGDSRFMADATFAELVEAGWELRNSVALPSWPGLDEAVLLYARS
jgi:hypothetical protein